MPYLEVLWALFPPTVVSHSLTHSVTLLLLISLTSLINPSRGRRNISGTVIGPAARRLTHWTRPTLSPSTSPQSWITRLIKQPEHDQNDTWWATFIPHTHTRLGDYIIFIILLLLLSSMTASHYAIWLLSYRMMSNVILSAKLRLSFHLDLMLLYISIQYCVRIFLLW